ncbi:peptidylprolyl isomerase [Kurthia sibirica]|uniref:Peptidyl-prolyl cis-trans isomerase n=1 Tax=Kurthia sibirica TaxID=202750 RepID=A0A2U3AI39_9BACL|nr:peptidylprolyl isomerase [Kurthia sibirica]PWI24154.1 peptidylprolyl isomerase [Kurthia sibirica]GEK34678.1 putative peptidyl-prolyl cis-trans isomerase [Kurthia sibirica]
MFPQLNSEVQENEILVEMDTTMGPIEIKLFPELAPKTVENFLTHAKNGYYDDIIFHRIIKDFMIQGGDPTGTGMGGESIYGSNFEDEFNPELINMRGALSMANAGPGTNGSQFFIVQASNVDPSMLKQMKDYDYPEEVIEAYAKNGGTPWLDGKHTVFGQVVKGLKVIDQMAQVKKDGRDKPVEPISIVGISVLNTK